MRFPSSVKLKKNSIKPLSEKKDSIRSRPTKYWPRLRRSIWRLRPQVLPTRSLKKVLQLFPLKKSLRSSSLNSMMQERSQRTSLARKGSSLTCLIPRTSRTACALWYSTTPTWTRRPLRMKDSTPRTLSRPRQPQWPWLWPYRPMPAPPLSTTSLARSQSSRTSTQTLPSCCPRSLQATRSGTTSCRRCLPETVNSTWFHMTARKKLTTWKHSRLEKKVMKLSRKWEMSPRFSFPARLVMFWKVMDLNQALIRFSDSSTLRDTKANTTDFLEIEKNCLGTNICLY